MHVRSDVERKRLFGVAPKTRLPDHAYAPEISDEVYAICRKRARLALKGRADGDRRCRACEAGGAGGDRGCSRRKHGVPFTGLWLEAPREVMRERVAGAKAMSPTRRPPWSMSSSATTSARKASRSSMPGSRSIEVAAASLEAIGATAAGGPSFIFC